MRRSICMTEPKAVPAGEVSQFRYTYTPSSALEGGASAPTTESSPPQAGYFSYATDTIYSCGERVDHAFCGVPGYLIGFARSGLGMVFGFLSSVKTYIYERCCYTAVAKAREVGAQMRAATTPTDKILALQALNVIKDARGDDPDRVNDEVKKAAEFFVGDKENLAFEAFVQYYAKKEGIEYGGSEEELLPRAKKKLLENPRSAFVEDFLAEITQGIPTGLIEDVKQAICDIRDQTSLDNALKQYIYLRAKKKLLENPRSAFVEDFLAEITQDIPTVVIEDVEQAICDIRDQTSLDNALNQYIYLVEMELNPHPAFKHNEKAMEGTCKKIFFTFPEYVQDVVADGDEEYTNLDTDATLFRGEHFKRLLNIAAFKVIYVEEASA